MPNIDIFKDLVEAVKKTSTPTTQAYDTPATVTRIEGDVAWVHIPGGVDETPVRLTIAAKAGDTVQLRVGGGTAWLVGNQSAPPTDDTKANEAIRQAKEASGVATDFVTDTQNGIFVHPKNNTADGVRITDSIEIIKGKLSFFRAWIDGELAKVRVGRADSGHVEISAKGLKVYAGSGLYGSDVAAFAADYAALHVVAGEAYHRDGALGDGVCRAALDGAYDYIFCLLVRLVLGLGLYVLDHYGRLMADVLFEVPQKQLLGFFGGASGDPLQFRDLLLYDLVYVLFLVFERLLSALDVFFFLFYGLQLSVHRFFFLCYPAFGFLYVVPALLYVLLGFHLYLVSLGLGLGDQFLSQCFSSVFCVQDKILSLCLGTSDSLFSF